MSQPEAKRDRVIEEKKMKFCNRMAMSLFQSAHSTKEGFMCCHVLYTDRREFCRHVMRNHSSDLRQTAVGVLEKGSEKARWSVLRKKAFACESDCDTQNFISKAQSKCTIDEIAKADAEGLPLKSNCLWLPPPCLLLESENSSSIEEHEIVLLFYYYREVDNAEELCNWQTILCGQLSLTGKVRVAHEGINATLAGTRKNTTLYKKAVMSHPLFTDMKENDFKESPANSSKTFAAGLQVAVHSEICCMGVRDLNYAAGNAGEHVTPSQFHKVLQCAKVDPNIMFVDCRNFYESRIGRFKGAVIPNIRKFSYWPEFVDKNEAMFKGKQVYMYCTGGIRCEKGSAYLQSKNICQSVRQLKGGIHKYLEEFGDGGNFQGSLFVFDDRYAIFKTDVSISKCQYCDCGWQDYDLCSSMHCHQFVLICSKCRREKGLSSCCHLCAKNSAAGIEVEQCKCTQRRERTLRLEAAS